MHDWSLPNTRPSMSLLICLAIFRYNLDIIPSLELAYWMLLKRRFVSGIYLSSSYRYLESTTGIPRSTLYPQIQKMLRNGWITKEPGKWGRLIFKPYSDIYDNLCRNRWIKGDTPKELLEEMRYCQLRWQEQKQYAAYEIKTDLKKLKRFKSKRPGFSDQPSWLNASSIREFTLSLKAAGELYGISSQGAYHVLTKFYRDGRLWKAPKWSFSLMKYSDYLLAYEGNRKYFYTKKGVMERQANLYSTKGAIHGVSVKEAIKKVYLNQQSTY